AGVPGVGDDETSGLMKLPEYLAFLAYGQTGHRTLQKNGMNISLYGRQAAVVSAGTRTLLHGPERPDFTPMPNIEQRTEPVRGSGPTPRTGILGFPSAGCADAALSHV